MTDKKKKPKRKKIKINFSAEALSKNLSITDVFREGLAELLNEDDEGMDEGEMAFRFSGEEDDKWIDWFSKERELRD